MLSPNPQPPPVTVILDAHELRVLEIPNVNRLLDMLSPHFPFKKTFAEALLFKIVCEKLRNFDGYQICACSVQLY